jgi:hypothetical protein
VAQFCIVGNTIEETYIHKKTGTHLGRLYSRVPSQSVEITINAYYAR